MVNITDAVLASTLKESALRRNADATLLYEEINRQAGSKGKNHDKNKIEDEALCAHHNFKRAEVGDFCRRSGYHERGSGTETHAVGEARLQEGNRPAAACVERHPCRRCGQNAEGFVPSKSFRHQIGWHVPLKQRRKSDASQKVWTCRDGVPPYVFQIARWQIRVRVAAGRLFEALKAEKRFFVTEAVYQQSGGGSAEEAGGDTHRERRRP